MESDWAERAACKDKETAKFFPSKWDEFYVVDNFCKTCPVRLECLSFALDNKIEFGIWGGHNTKSRKRILKKRKREVA